MLWEFFKLYPTPEAAVKADCRELAQLLNPLGLHEKRAQILIRFSGRYFLLLEAGSQIVPETQLHYCTLVQEISGTHGKNLEFPEKNIPTIFISYFFCCVYEKWFLAESEKIPQSTCVVSSGLVCMTVHQLEIMLKECATCARWNLVYQTRPSLTLQKGSLFWRVRDGLA